jgi:hypothetical protein
MTMLDKSTFGFLAPTPVQKEGMELARSAAAEYAATLMTLLPEGPDKTYALRKLREVAMWANISITRHSDGRPRQ